MRSLRRYDTLGPPGAGGTAYHPDGRQPLCCNSGSCACSRRPSSSCAMPSTAICSAVQEAKPRRQFVTITLDWLNTQPLHFAEHPLAGSPRHAGRRSAVPELRLRDARRPDPHRRARVQSPRARRRDHGLSARHQRRRDAGDPRQHREPADDPDCVRRSRSARQLRVGRRAAPTTSGRACSSPIGRRAGVSAAGPSCIGGRRPHPQQPG